MDYNITIKKKGEIFITFKRFNLLVKKKSKFSLKRLRINGRIGHSSIEYAQLCDS